MEKDINDYIDKWGLLVKGDDLDAGDSCHKTMHYWYCMNMFSPTKVSLFECKDNLGNYRRHPDTSKWYSECDRMSRDQSIPLLICLGTFLSHNNLKSFFKAHLKRLLLFTTNTRRNGATKANHGSEYNLGKFRNYNWKMPDLTGPTFWALYIRGFEMKTLFPLLIILDIFLVLKAFFERFTKSSDVTNFAMLVHYGSTRMKTPVSLFAYKITDWKDVQRKLDTYWGPNDEPPINITYKNLLEEFKA